MPPSKFNNDIFQSDSTCCNPCQKHVKFGVNIIKSYVAFHRPRKKYQ